MAPRRLFLVGLGFGLVLGALFPRADQSSVAPGLRRAMKAPPSMGLGKSLFLISVTPEPMGMMGREAPTLEMVWVLLRSMSLLSPALGCLVPLRGKTIRRSL